MVSEASASTPSGSRSPSYEQTIAAAREVLTRAVTRHCPPALLDRREDLVQDALMRVEPRMREGEVLPNSYLWKTAHTTIIDELRRERSMTRRHDGLATVHAAGEGDPSVGPDAHIRDTETRDAVRECMHELNDDRQSAVSLYLQGHGVPEIAALIDAPRKRVENLVYRSLAALRKCLEGKGVRP